RNSGRWRGTVRANARRQGRAAEGTDSPYRRETRLVRRLGVEASRGRWRCAGTSSVGRGGSGREKQKDGYGFAHDALLADGTVVRRLFYANPARPDSETARVDR